MARRRKPIECQLDSLLELHLKMPNTPGLLDLVLRPVTTTVMREFAKALNNPQTPVSWDSPAMTVKFEVPQPSPELSKNMRKDLLWEFYFRWVLHALSDGAVLELDEEGNIARCLLHSNSNGAKTEDLTEEEQDALIERLCHGRPLPPIIVENHVLRQNPRVVLTRLEVCFSVFPMVVDHESRIYHPVGIEFRFSKRDNPARWPRSVQQDLLEAIGSTSQLNATNVSALAQPELSSDEILMRSVMLEDLREFIDGEARLRVGLDAYARVSVPVKLEYRDLLADKLSKYVDFATSSLDLTGELPKFTPTLEYNTQPHQSTSPLRPNKSQRGRPSDPKTQLRKEIVRKHIRKAGDFFASKIKKELIDELTTNKIPVPKDKDSFLYANEWAAFLEPPSYKWQRVVENVLSRDRWVRNRPKITTE